MLYHVSVFMLCWRSKFYTLILFWYISSVCVCVYVRANENRTFFHRDCFFGIWISSISTTLIFMCKWQQRNIQNSSFFVYSAFGNPLLVLFFHHIFFPSLTLVRTCSTEYSIEVSNHTSNWFPCKHIKQMQLYSPRWLLLTEVDFWLLFNRELPFFFDSSGTSSIHFRQDSYNSY